MKTSLSYESCTIISNVPIVCTLCGKPVVGRHSCSRPKPAGFRQRTHSTKPRAGVERKVTDQKPNRIPERAAVPARKVVAAARSKERACRRCGCTQFAACIDERSGDACFWVERNLCSACLTPKEHELFLAGFPNPSGGKDPKGSKTGAMGEKI